MNPAHQHVSEPFRTVLNNTWDSARTAARKPPTTAQADEALSRDLGVPYGLSTLWSMMRRPDDTVFLAPGDHGDDPTCLAVYPNRAQADEAVERWDRENERRLKLDAEFPGGKDVAWAERDEDGGEA